MLYHAVNKAIMNNTVLYPRERQRKFAFDWLKSTICNPCGKEPEGVPSKKVAPLGETLIMEHETADNSLLKYFLWATKLPSWYTFPFFPGNFDCFLFSPDDVLER